MEVEKTVSPKILLGAPKDLPTKDCPVLRCNAPGAAVTEPTGVARPRAKVGMRMIWRANMAGQSVDLEVEERKYEVAEITTKMVRINGRERVRNCLLVSGVLSEKHVLRELPNIERG